MSKMLAAILDLKLKTEVFRDNIRELILSDRSCLMNLRLSYGNLRLNNKPWRTPYDDVMALDEYLATQSPDNLLNIYNELTTSLIVKQPNYLKNLFRSGKESLFRCLYKIMLFRSKFPTIFGLKNRSYKILKYIDGIVKGIKINRDVDRKLLQTTSYEQKINEFLSYIKILIAKGQLKKAYKLQQVVEKKLLGGLITTIGMDGKVEARIINNLRTAYVLVGKLSLIEEIPNLLDRKIKSAASLVRQLIINMRYLKENIQDPLITQEKKRSKFVLLQEKQIKLLHFIIKTDALSKGKTLYLNQDLDLEYMIKQLNKLPVIDEGERSLNDNTYREDQVKLRLFDLPLDAPSHVLVNPPPANVDLARASCQIT